MTVATKIMMGSGAVAEAYEIEQSIIYNSASNSQMYFDPSSNFTSETVFTFSTWVKRASTGASQRLLTAGYYTDGNNQSGMSIQFHSSDVLRVNLKRVGGVTYNNQNIDSAAVFRDPAAWYHILVTRNGTAIKGYVNGVEVLSGTMTANSVVGIQNTYPVMVGVSSKPTSSAIGAYQSFNGNLAETHFIDGTAKATSDFGETNSDTGQWIPKEYSGSYGTNGFHLPFSKNGGGGSAYFDGSGDGINFPTNSDFNFASNNFCIEGWVYRTRANGTRSYLISQYNDAGSNATGSVGIELLATNKFKCIVTSAADNDVYVGVEASVTNSPNTWYHVAAVRNGNTLTLYQDGTSVGSATVNFAVNYPSSEAWDIGKIDGLAWQSPWQGYISNVRIVNGSPVYTGNFTPSTTPLTNITNTKLLMNGGVSSLVGPNLTATGNTSFAVNQPFGSSVTTFASDTSGQGNSFIAANLANSDVVPDSPTNNFATLNPLYTGSVSNTFSEGNLKIVTPSTGYGTSTATIVPTSGKYYAEFKGTTGGDSGTYGVRDVSMAATNSTWLPAGSTKNMGYQGSNGNIYYNGTSVLSSAPATFTTNDVIAVAIDYDNSTVKWYKNNSLQYTATSADLENVTFAASDSGNSGGVTAEANFGQKTLAYTPPSGYVALSTANLPDPAIPLPSAHFNTVLYTGNGGTNAITGVGFQPDWVWAKVRDEAYSHGLFDAVRGVTKKLSSNLTNAEVTDSGLTAFGSDGFTMGSDAGMNGSSKTYVAWNWKANGAGSNDTSGDIDATVSANQTAGFSIVTWTSNGSNNGTVPHGLGVTPEVVLYKVRSGTSHWNFLTTVIDGSNDYLQLNTTAAKGDVSSAYGNFTSSFFTNLGFANSATMVAYAFASKPSFSKIGSYTGNGNASGPFINTGFRPAWVMIKRTDSTGNWLMYDNKRPEYNAAYYLLANDTFGGNGSDVPIDILSNGFKIKNSTTASNANNGVYLYLAFAESPFKTANAR